MAKKHTVATRTPIMVGGRQVGESVVAEYVDGPPKFGRCQWFECSETATDETLLGTQLCRKHFAEFYFGDED